MLPQGGDLPVEALCSTIDALLGTRHAAYLSARAPYILANLRSIQANAHVLHITPQQYVEVAVCALRAAKQECTVQALARPRTRVHVSRWLATHYPTRVAHHTQPWGSMKSVVKSIQLLQQSHDPILTLVGRRGILDPVLLYDHPLSRRLLQLKGSQMPIQIIVQCHAKFPWSQEVKELAWWKKFKG